MSLMQRIPLHAKEVKVFKPDCLAGQPEIPSFTLKAATRQHREDMMYAIREAGLRKHSDEDMREATIEELQRLWECDEKDEGVQRLRAYWQALDDYNEDIMAAMLESEAAKDAGEDVPSDLVSFEHPDSVDVADLIDRLERRSDRLRRMGVDNLKFKRMLPRYAIAHCVTGWTGLTTPPRFEDELLKIGTVYELEEEMESRFGVSGQEAISELAAAAIARFFLSKESEKNSASGPASLQTPTPTKETGSVSPNGKSRASASSDETQDG